MSRACLESADSTCHWDCGIPATPGCSCRKRIARELRVMAKRWPGYEFTGTMTAAAALIERLGREAERHE